MIPRAAKPYLRFAAVTIGLVPVAIVARLVLSGELMEFVHRHGFRAWQQLRGR